MDLGHLSYSSINRYHACPRSFKFHYLDKIVTPKATALAFGSAFHHAVENYVAARALGADRDLIPLWHEMWNDQVAVGDIDWRDDTPEALCNDGVRILSNEEVLAVLSDVVPLMVDDEPVVEKYIELQVPGVPVPVIGYIDVITADGVPCDFKTSSRSWYADKAQAEMQPVFYLAALTQEGFSVDGMRFRHYVFVKTKKPQVQVIETQRSVGEMFWLFELIQDTWHAIEAGAFPPNPTTWKCSEKWCEYFSICRGGAM